MASELKYDKLNIHFLSWEMQYVAKRSVCLQLQFSDMQSFEDWSGLLGNIEI